MLHWVKEKFYLIQTFLMIFILILVWKNYRNMKYVVRVTETMSQENKELRNQIETTNWYIVAMVKQHLTKKDTIVQLKEKTYQ
jgi:hypothetical protein